MDLFSEYKKSFEVAVIGGMLDGTMGSVKAVQVMPGKLHQRRIGRTMGAEIDSGEVIVIDYYGYMKKSRGFFNLIHDLGRECRGKQIKTVDAPVVHFNSIRLEVIAKIDPELVVHFGDFKKAVLDAREFKHTYKA